MSLRRLHFSNRWNGYGAPACGDVILLKSHPNAIRHPTLEELGPYHFRSYPNRRHTLSCLSREKIIRSVLYPILNRYQLIPPPQMSSLLGIGLLLIQASAVFLEQLAVLIRFSPQRYRDQIPIQ